MQTVVIISKRLCEPHKRWKRGRRRSKRIKEASRVAKRKGGWCSLLHLGTKFIAKNSAPVALHYVREREREGKRKKRRFTSLPYFSMSLTAPVPKRTNERTNERMFTAVSKIKLLIKVDCDIATTLCDATRMRGAKKKGRTEWRCSRKG